MATVRIQLRRGTEQQWYDANPTLAPGEIGIETDTNTFKFGDGTTAWRDLSYALSDTVDDYILLSEKGQALGVATLDASGFVPTSQLPPLAKITVHSVANEAGRLALTVEPGDIAIQSDTGTTYVLQSSPANTNANWKELTATKAIQDAVDAAVSGLLDGAPGVLNTLNELAEAIGNDPTFFTTVATNLSNHEADTTDVHGIADTALLATKAYADQAETDAISTAAADATSKANAAQAAAETTAATALSNHNSDTTDVHGIADTALLATKAYADQAETDAISTAAADATSKANAAQAAAETTAATALSNHNSDTTDVHGIADTALLATKAYADQAETDAKSYTDSEVSELESSVTSSLALKAPIASPTFTGTVSGITKSMVGLGNVDDTSDNNKPISSATQTALDLKAPLSSPNLTGVPTAPTANSGTNTNQIATTQFVSTAVSDLINGAPGALNTLNELALALGNDENFSASVTANLASKAPIENPSFTGTVTLPSTTSIGSISDVEIGYLNNLTSNIQTQLNSKLSELDATNTYKTIAAAQTDLDNHNNDTTNVHGIADTSILATTTGNQTLSNKTLTTPIIVNSGYIQDENSNEQIRFNTVNSAVNEITVSNSATGNAPTISATGNDENISLNLASKGSGFITVNGIPVASTTGSLTFTNKTINLNNNILSGTKSEFNASLSDADFITSTDTGTVVTAILADNAVTAAKLADDSVDTASVINGAISTTKIADGSITEGKISAGAVSTTILADNAVTAAKLADNAVDTASIVDVAVTTAKIADGAITSAKIADGTIVAGDLADDSVTVSKILNNSVTADKLADNAVDTASIVDVAVTTAKIADVAVTTAKIADGAITSAKIADGAIVTADIADGAITSDKIANGSILNADINASAAISQSKIENLTTDLSLKAPIASPTFTGTVSGITKSMVGLGNVDDTSDANKPISTATQTALDAKAPIASPTFTGTVSGITKSMVGLGNVDNTSDANKPISTATQTALDAKAPIASPTFTGTVSGITKSMVGLGNVDNTSDANKPISTATQTALDAKASLSGATFTGSVEIDQNLVVDGNLTVNGTTFSASSTSIVIEDNIVQLAHENAGNTVDLGLVVGYNDGSLKHAGIVRDVSDDTWKLFKGVTSEPTTTVNFGQGSLDNLQVDGLVASSATIGDVSNTELQYLNGVTSAVQTQINAKAPIASPTFTGTVSGITKSMVGLGNVDDTSDANKPISTATQTALDAKAPIASPTFTGTVTVAATGIAFTDGTQSKEGVPSRTPLYGAATGGNTAGSARTSNTNLSVLGLSARDNMIEVDSTSQVTITIPLNSTTAYPIGTSIDILRVNTGDVIIDGAAGVTINATPQNATNQAKLRARWSSATLFKRGTDSWVVMGDLSA